MKILIIIILFMLFVEGGSMYDRKNHHKGYELFQKADIRFKDKEKYFSSEYEEINQRRNKLYPNEIQELKKPKHLIGVGFSGGGIKASAFHLGLLSGLHQAGLLSHIDYISSVSGGSWANGTYWALHETDDTIFECLDIITHAKDLNNIPNDKDIYRCKKYKVLLPNKQNRFLGSRDWQRHIRSNYLLNDDITFSDFLKYDKKHLSNKPFPIFMTTHTNKIAGTKSEENFPFEITPLGFGTIADCKTEIDGKTCGLMRRIFRPHLWQYPPQKGFYIDYETKGNIDITIKKYFDDGEKDLRLSHAMWASGGLIAKVLSMHLRISQNDKQVPGIKKKYVLSDGGKTDNTGLLPLVERGVDLIILSQIAGDPNIKLGDIDIASKQVKRLFDVEIQVDNLKNHEGHQPLISESAYTRNKNILFIKPTPENIDEFYNSQYSNNKYVKYLKANENIKDTKLKFPQNSTMKTDYPQEVIYGYYLLGRFIGNEKLVHKIKGSL